MTGQRRSLREAAAIRIGISLLTAAIVAAVAAIAVYQTTLDRVTRTRIEGVMGDYRDKMRSIERSWDEFLVREKLRLELTRLLDRPEGRWDRLQAYLNTLADTPQYAGMTICTASGIALFRQGPDPGCSGPSGQDNGERTFRYFTDAAGGLFVAMDAPVWLGPDGMGRMRLAVPIDHGLLWSSAFVGSKLLVVWHGRQMASSSGESGLSALIHPHDGERFKLDEAYFVQGRIGFPGKGDTPELLIQTQIELPLSVSESAGLGVTIFLVLDTLIVLALRGWLVKLLPRIESLGQAAHLYRRDGRLTTELEAQLTIAAGGKTDELTDVADATHSLLLALTEREQARLVEEARRRHDEERLRLSDKVFENSAQAIVIADADWRIVSVNPAFCLISGYASTELLGTRRQLTTSAAGSAMSESLARYGTWSGELWDKRKNGDGYPQWMTVNAVRDGETGDITHYVSIFSDISEQKENAAQIEHLAYHDPLTGLPNRFALNAHLAQSLADARRNDGELAVMFIDLDRFKTINDSLGHDIGDQLLIAVAQRIRALLRESDTVARLGGDEFVIVVPNVNGPEDAAHVAEKVISEVGEPMTLAGHVLHATPSIGICMFPADGNTAEMLLKNADAAMYHAKQHGRNAYHFFTADMNAAANERLLLETRLHRALDRGEFVLAYQPQIELRSGRVVCVEALVRWRHPDRGEIPPAEFIPVAEEIGLILPLGEWVVEEACRQAMAWGAAASDIRIAVNLSARQLKSRQFVDHVAATLIRTGLPPNRLEMEITESSVIDHPETAVETLRALAALGVRLTIDDFGTGYSSLAYLRRLPCSRLKIDRCFVQGLTTDDNDTTIAQGIVALAGSLGLAVTAEGIETAAQLELLMRIGCREGQGFLFSRPLSPEALQAYLTANPSPARP